jgi:nucleotide-binding universal stress UspA family protein
MAAINKVLAAIDDESNAAQVLETAISITSARADARLIVLTVVDSVGVATGVPGVPFPATTGLNVEALRRRIEESLARFQDAHPEMTVPNAEIHTAIGKPADEIVWLAAHLDVELIIVGSHSRRGIKRWLLGSVAERVVRLAGCPVIVARAKQHHRADKTPQIEPLCSDCARTRANTEGRVLWCARHAEHHIRPHVYGYGSRGVDSPNAGTSSTGTVR